MRIFIWIGSILMGVIGVAAVHAQPECTIQVQGQVVDAASGEGLSFASVFFENTDRGAYADSSGNFSISDLCPGHYVLRVTHVGCAPEKVNLRVHSDTTITFRLSHDDAILEEFVL